MCTCSLEQSQSILVGPVLHLASQHRFEHACVCDHSFPSQHCPSITIHCRLHELFLYWCTKGTLKMGWGFLEGKPGNSCGCGLPQTWLLFSAKPTPVPICFAPNRGGCQMRSTNCGWRLISSRPEVGHLWRACIQGERLLLKPCFLTQTPLRWFWGTFLLGPPNAVGIGYFSASKP